jgi:hypothetical protein
LLLNPARRPALFYPNLFEPHAGNYIARTSWRQTGSCKDAAGWDVRRLTLTFQPTIQPTICDVLYDL